MMTRRSLLAGFPALAGLRAQSSRPPNILFFLTDDQRWNAAGFMGDPVVRTPNMDRIASGGTVFTNNFVTTSICMTSRASILTGLYARAHRCNDFKDQLTDDLYRNSFPGLLRAAGYRTGYAGKWGVGPENQQQNRYDYFRAFRGQGDLLVDSEGRKVGSSRLLARQAIEFLRGSSHSKPFCMQVSYNSPHAQDNAPWQYLYEPDYEKMYKDAKIAVPETADPRYWSRFPQSVQRSESRRRWAIRFATPELYQETIRRYYRLISGIDESIGSILTELARLGMDGNTVVIFTSDNGYYYGEYGFADKWLMHEPSIRTPMAIYDPRANRRGRRTAAMSLNIDIAPTILDLAGIGAPPSMQGRSLVPFTRAEPPAWRRDWFYEHWYRHSGWIPGTEGVRTGRWKYTRYLDENPLFEELYDLERDPLEKDNLALSGEHRDRLQRLRARRETWTRSLEGWRSGQRWQEPAFDPQLG